jgi:hypothetical protein
MLRSDRQSHIYFLKVRAERLVEHDMIAKLVVIARRDYDDSIPEQAATVDLGN